MSPDAKAAELTMLAFYSTSINAVARMDDDQIRAVCWLIGGDSRMWTRDKLVSEFQRLTIQHVENL